MLPYFAINAENLLYDYSRVLVEHLDSKEGRSFLRAANENLAEFRLFQSTVACQNPFPVLWKLSLKYQNHFYIS